MAALNHIKNFDEYCLALKSEGELNARARLIHYLRSQLIGVQQLDSGEDENKLNYIGLSEILSMPEPEPCDELGRIARSTFKPMRYISSSFREKILRENVMQPIYRVKEIDSAGLNWLSKRSGRTIQEKLSSTNSMLAVRRRMSLDTGENRLFLAFVRQMEEYIEEKQSAASELVTEFEQDFQSFGLKLLRDDALDEVKRWENLPPNNTLLSDRFYRQIWRGWLDLQNVSEMLAEDSRRLSERICTVFYWKLLGAASNYCRFPQQPVLYDYASFMLKPLRGDSIVGFSSNGLFRLSRLNDRIRIDFGETYVIAFDDMTAILLHNGTELKREMLTVDNFDALIGQAIDFIFGECDRLSVPSTVQSPLGKEVYIDLFSTRPLYFSPGNSIERFNSRIVRQIFRAEDEMYDLPVDGAAALTLPEDDSTELYSIASCIHSPKDEHEKFQNLFRMVHERLSSGEHKIDQLSIPLPDIYNEFQLSAIRRAVRIYYNRLQTMPRSVAVLFNEMSSGNCSAFNDGDFALVVDYIRGRASMTLVEAKIDPLIEKALPETRGLIWERHPTYSEVCSVADYDDFEAKLNDLLLKSGFDATEEVIDKILGVFGVKGLPLEMNALALELVNALGDHNGNWIELTQDVLKILPQTQFSVTDAVKNYIKRMSGIIGRNRVHTYIISPQLKFIGAGATLRTGGRLPLQGMQFYSQLQNKAQQFERLNKKILPPLWSDQLPELAIKRLYGVFELIGGEGSNKVSPQFGVEQTIPIAQHFTLPHGQKEYRFGLILGDSREISYEAVVRHRAFPLSTDVECELHLTYTYGRDIPYELIFKPLNSQAFSEAIVSWESAGARPFDNLPVPAFPVNPDNWQTLQHIKTHTSNDRDALDWIENTLKPLFPIDFNAVNYNTNAGSPVISVNTTVDGKPALIHVLKKILNLPNSEDHISGAYSGTLCVDKKDRFSTTFNYGEWRNGRNGWYCYKRVDDQHQSVAFYENELLFAHPTETIGHRVTFNIFERNGKMKANNILIDDGDYRYYWLENVTVGKLDYNFKKMSVMFPLHKVYANGRSSRTPGCPDHFRACAERLSKDLPQKFLSAFRADDIDLCKKLLRIMCVMASDIGKPLYDFLRVILDQRPEMLDDDAGCALGDYDRAEQQQLLMQLIASKMSESHKIYILAKAAWKSDGFILNVPAQYLLQYFDYAIDFVCERSKHIPKNVVKALEYILAIFRLRSRGNETLNKYLSLNNKKVRTLYNELEDMIADKYQMPESRVRLEVKRNAEYDRFAISDFLYALLVYVTGSNDEIKILGVSEDEDG